MLFTNRHSDSFPFKRRLKRGFVSTKEIKGMMKRKGNARERETNREEMRNKVGNKREKRKKEREENIGYRKTDR
jgi:hypothetical protein